VTRWVTVCSGGGSEPPLGSPLFHYGVHVGTARNLGYGEGSVYKETVRRASGLVTIWRGEITIDGKRRRITRSTRTAALRELDKLRATANAGLPVGDDTRLGQFLDWYVMKVVAQKHPNTQSNYVWAYKQLEPLRAKRLRELTPNDVETLLEQLTDRKPPSEAQKRRGGRQKPLSRSSLSRIRSCLGAALMKAQARNLLDRNIARLVELPADAPGPIEKKAFTPEEAQRLLASVAGDRYEAMILVAIMLGLRPGEVLGLPWKAVDLDERTLEIKQSLQRLPGGDLVIGPPKKDSFRTVRLPDRVIVALRTHRVHQKTERLKAPVWGDHGLVFPSAIGTPMDFSNLRRTVQGRCRQARVRELSPNEFRHSAATLLIEADVPIHQVADMLGHKDTRMLAKHYRHKRGVADVTEGQERMLGDW
jgi:integrase